MAHLFTAPFGRWPLRLAGKGVISIDTGLVEGIAVAADWHPEEPQSAPGICSFARAEKAPDIRTIFWSGRVLVTAFRKSIYDDWFLREMVG